MTTDRTEQLIVELASSARPVTRLPPLPVRLVGWAVVAMLAAAAGVWLIGPRHNLPAALGTPAFLMTLAIALLTAGLSAAAALRLSVPGADASRLARRLSVAALVAWIALLWQLSRSAGVSTSALLAEPWHAACGARVALLSLIPSLALLRSVRMGFALDRVWAASLAVLAGAAVAAAAVQAVCPIDRPAHLLVAHALPAVALAVVGALSARGLLSTLTASNPSRG